jgi:regulatory protein
VAADAATDVEGAREAALRALSARGRSRSELDSLLRAKGFESDAISAALERLEGVGLVDDAALARDLVARASSDQAGAALRAALQRRGIDRHLADEVVGELPDRPGAAEAVLAKRWNSLRGLPASVASRRAQGLLARRGFDPSQATAIIAKLRDEEA